MADVPRRAGAVFRTPLPWLAALMLAYLLVPLGGYVVRLAGTGRAATGAPGIGAALLMSLATATASTVLIALFGVPLGYLLARSRGRAARALGVLVQVPLALPPLMSGILLVYLVGPYSPLGELTGGRLTDSPAGIVLAQTFVAAPFLIVAARSAFTAVDPALDDVAATLGHGRWARFRRVAVPAAAHGIRAGLLLAWLRAFGEFGATVVLAYHPYTLPVFTYVQFGGTGLATTMLPVGAGLLAAVLVLLLGDRALPRRRRAALPDPMPPAGPAGPALSFEVDTRAGGFRLRVEEPAAGRRLAVLGPSGAGKSLLLRALAGLVPVGGRMLLDGRDVAGLPAERRGIGYLPQDPALLPGRTVAEQITFGVDADPAVAAHWLHRLRLTGLADRRPGELSGGQRRRVALARALARRPGLLLLDEPFAGLDPPVARELREELRRLQRETGIGTVVVTHDPDEAALLADRVVVLSGGAVLQLGDQADVYRRPAGPAVAHLLGLPDVRHARTDALGALPVGGAAVPTDPPAPPDTTVAWSARPDRLALTTDGTGPAGTVTDVLALAGRTDVMLALDGGGHLTVPAGGRVPAEGERVHLAIPPDAVLWWPTGRDDRTPVSAPSGSGAPAPHRPA